MSDLDLTIPDPDEDFEGEDSLDESTDQSESVEATGQESQTSDTEELVARVSDERVRQVHAVCLMLDREARPERRAQSEQSGSTLAVQRSNAFTRGVMVLAVIMATVTGGGAWLASRPDARAVDDYRLGVDYREADATSAALSLDGNQLLLATSGAGVQSISSRSRFLDRFTARSTGGGLLSDAVMRIDRDDLSRLYFLCQREDRLGLCRSSTALTDWKTLIGFDRFEPLDLSDPMAELSAACQAGDVLWIGTRSGGVGGYSIPTHSWAIHLKQADDGLIDNRIRDLKATGDGRLWIATAGGLNSYETESQVWQRFTTSDGLAGTDVVRLYTENDRVWYVTAGGGLGRIDEAKDHQLLAPETGWSRYSDSDLASVLPDRAMEELWFVSHKSAAARYSHASRQWTDYGSGNISGRVTSAAILPANPDRLLVGTDQSLRALTIGPTSAESTWQTLFAGPVEQIDAGPQSVVATRVDAASPRQVVVSRNATSWQRAIGAGSAGTDPGPVLAAAADPDSDRVWLSTAKGFSSYDTRTHDWSSRIDPGTDGAPDGVVIDAVVRNGNPVVLTSEGMISRLNAADGSWSHWIGGGQFPGSLQDVTAVSRDPAGRLWIGTQSKGLFTYDTALHRWEEAGDVQDIRQIETSRQKVWIVAGDQLLVAEAGAPPVVVSEQLPGVDRIAASPDADGAVVVCQGGQTVLTADDGTTDVVVGAPAPGLDLAAVRAIGVLGDRVVVGGQRPAVYFPSRREWLPLQSGGPVDQIVSSAGTLWLRAESRLLRLGDGTATVPIPVQAPVVEIAGSPRMLAVLSRDHSLRVRTKIDGPWQTIREAPSGPGPGFLSAAAFAAAASQSDLYLAGDGVGWHFSWSNQKWTPLADGEAPLKDLRQLAISGGAIFALKAGGTLLSARVGAAILEPDELNQPVARISCVEGSLSAVLKSQETAFLRPGGWEIITGTLAEQSVGPVRDLFRTADGVVIAGDQGTVWLAEGLSRWQKVTLPNNARVTRLAGRTGSDDLWATTSRGTMLHFTRKGWTWNPVPFPRPVASLTLVPVAQGAVVPWVCLDDGSVFRVAGNRPMPVSQPTRAPGPPAEIAGVSSVTRGFLVAFRSGKLRLFDSRSRSWSTVPPPAGDPISDLISVGSDPASGFCLLQFADGSLYRSSRNARQFAWRPVAGGVQSVQPDFGAEEPRGVVVSDGGRSLKFVESDDEVAIVSASDAPQTNWGSIVSAAEFNTARGLKPLLLAWQKRLAVYDPETRQWQSQQATVRGLTAAQNGVYGIDDGGQLVLVTLQNGDLELEVIKTPEPVQAVAADPDSTHVVVSLTNGQLRLMGDPQRTRTLIGTALPESAGRARIRDVTSSGPSLYLTESSGSVHKYDAGTRAWESVPGYRGVSRLLTRSDIIWAEEATAQRKLSHWNPAANQPAPNRLPGELLHWHETPAGILAVQKVDDVVKRTLHVDGGQQSEITVASTLGPAAASVRGARVAGDDVWLQTDRGVFWTRPITGQWKRVLTAGGLADVVRFTPNRVWVQDADGDIHLGRWNQAASLWNFNQVSQNTDSFDADTRHSLELSKQQVRVSTVDRQAVATLDFSSRAFGQSGEKPRSVAVQGTQLAVAGDRGSASLYDLSKRAWQRTAAPDFRAVQVRPVGAGWRVVGAKGEVASLVNGKWQEHNQRAAPAYSGGGFRYAVDPTGTLTVSRAGQNAAEPGQPATVRMEAGLVRISELPEALAIELADGTLWRYSLSERKLERVATGTQKRLTGLVTAAGSLFFVQENDGVLHRVAADGTVQRVALPDDFKPRTVRVLIHADGLLLDGTETGVFVDQKAAKLIEEEADLSELRDAAVAPAPNRLKSGKRWRIVAGQQNASARLEFLDAGRWSPISISANPPRLEWDAAMSVLSADNQLIVLTRTGVVVRNPDGRGLPVRWIRMAGLDVRSRTAAAWSEDRQLHVVAADGRHWRLPLPITAETTPIPVKDASRQWSVTREQNQWRYQLTIGNAQPIPLTLDAQGRFSMDVVRSVALFGDSVYLATGAGLFVYSRDLQEVRSVRAGGPCEVLTSVDRTEVYLQQAGSIIRSDGRQWLRSDSNWQQIRHAVGFRDHQPGTAIRLTVRLGEGPLARHVTQYVGQNLGFDQLVNQTRALTTDGTRLFEMTPDGLVVRNRRRRILEVHSNARAVAMEWAHSPAEGSPLFLLKSDESGWQYRNGAVTAVSSVRQARGNRRLKWQGQDFTLTSGEPGKPWQLSRQNAAPYVLSLSARGFLRDRVLRLATTDRNIWAAGPAGINRFVVDALQGTRFESRSLEPNSLKLVRDRNRMLLLSGSSAFELSGDAATQPVSLGQQERASLQRLLTGRQWAISAAPAGAGQTTTRTVQLQAAPGRSLSTRLRPGGFDWDLLRAAGFSNDRLICVTAAGDFVVDRSRVRAPIALRDLTPMRPGQSEGGARHLWTDSRGGLWSHAGAGRWQKFDSQSSSWTAAGPLPDALQTERRRLSRSSTSVWQRTTDGSGIEFVETTGSGKSVTSSLKPDGSFAFSRVRAVLPVDGSVWLVTDQDLRQLESRSGRLLESVSLPTGSDVPRAEFRSDLPDWHLQLQRGGKVHRSILKLGAWQPSAVRGPFEPGAGTVQTNRIRMGISDESLTVEVRVSPEGDRWQPVDWQDDGRRLSLQASTDVAAFQGHALTATKAGVVVWKRKPTGDWEYDSLRPDLRQLVSPAAGNRLLAADAQGRPEHYDPEAGWKATELTSDERTLIAHSAPWKIARVNNSASIHIAMKHGDQQLPLAKQGGFEFAYPQTLTVLPDGKLWMASPQAVAQVGASGPTQGHPALLFTRPGAEDVPRLFSVDGRLHVRLARRLQALDRDNRWQSGDEQATTAAQNRIWSDDEWSWTVRDGRLTAQRKLGGQQHDLKWDRSRGRFLSDVATDAARRPGQVWLSGPAGLVRVDSQNGRSTHAFAASRPLRIVQDRISGTSLADSPRDADGFVSLTLNDDGDLPAYDDAARAEQVARSLFTDQEWSFARDGIVWNGLQTDLSGRFQHDDFYSLAAFGDELLTTTSVAVFRWQVQASGLSVAAAETVPVSDEPYQVDRVAADRLRAITKSADVFERQLPDGDWRPVADAVPERVLVDSSEWQWSRLPDGVRLEVKTADVRGVDPVFTGDGRFVFDDVKTVLANNTVVDAGDAVLLAGSAGIVWQSIDDGRLLRWDRQGDANGVAVPLTGIQRIGRFSASGDPVPSWASDEHLAKATLFAADDGNRVWRWDGDQNAGGWKLSKTNPFDAGNGLKILESGSLHAARSESGELRLAYAGSPGGVGVLSDGRLTIDSITDVCRFGDRFFLGTHAGVVETDDSGKDVRTVWTHDARVQSLAGVQVFTNTGSEHLTTGGAPTSDMLLAGLPDASVRPFDSENKRWMGPAESGRLPAGRLEVLSELWSWRRQGDQIQVALRTADSTTGPWPLFVSGRFSFDVLRGFRIEDDVLYAATPGGIVAFDRETMAVRQITRSAMDSDTREVVPMLDTHRFGDDVSLTCFSKSFNYRYVDGQWERSPGTRHSENRLYSAGRYQWRVRQLSPSEGGGLAVQLDSSTGMNVSQFHVLPGFDSERLRAVVAAPGRLWLCLDRGVYTIDVP